MRICPPCSPPHHLYLFGLRIAAPAMRAVRIVGVLVSESKPYVRRRGDIEGDERALRRHRAWPASDEQRCRKFLCAIEAGDEQRRRWPSDDIIAAASCRGIRPMACLLDEATSDINAGATRAAPIESFDLWRGIVLCYDEISATHARHY